MNRSVQFALLAAFALAGCQAPITQRYSISVDNNTAIKALDAKDVAFGQFAEPASFSGACRGGATMQVPDGGTHTQYIRKAFEDEFKLAASPTTATPRTLLTGRVTRLEFSSSRGITGGSWNIDLTLTSSNGKSMSVAEYYEFEAGFQGFEACRNVAEAFSRAVQNLVGKAVRDPAFRALLT